MSLTSQPEPPRREPAIFAPVPLIVLIGFLLGLHAYRAWITGIWEDADLPFLKLLAFVPARLTLALGLETTDSIVADILAQGAGNVPLKRFLFETFVASGGSALWTIVTYSFLHAGWEHVIFNSLWLLVFGSPVMVRFGLVRFTLFYAATAAAAAALHAAFNPSDVSVLIGASGAVSGMTAAALRFAIGGGGFDRSGWNRPAPPLAVMLRDRTVLVFLAVWFGLNLFAGLGIPVGAGADVRIAWEAHIGGFLAGLLLFPLFDPVR